jgi:hypothetical protein
VLYGPVQTLDRFLGSTKSLGPTSYFGIESSGPQWPEPYIGTLAFVSGEGGLPDTRAIMSIMSVPMVEQLCQAVMGCVSVFCTSKQQDGQDRTY